MGFETQNTSTKNRGAVFFLYPIGYTPYPSFHLLLLA